MKITQLKPNYQTYTNKPETSKQQFQAVSELDEKQVFKFLSANSIAFKGSPRYTEEQKYWNREIIYSVRELSNGIWGGAFPLNWSSEFKRKLNMHDFAYECRDNNYSETVAECIQNTIKTRPSGNDKSKETLKAMQCELFTHMLKKDEKLPDDMIEYFQKPENINEFLSNYSYINTDNSFNEEEVKNVLGRLENEFGIDVKQYPDALISTVRNRNKKMMNFLLEEGSFPFLKNDEGKSAYRVASDNFVNFELGNTPIINTLKSMKFSDEVVNALTRGKLALDGKTVEELINENLSNEEMKNQLLSSIEKSKNYKKYDNYPQKDKDFLKLIDSGKTGEIYEILHETPFEDVKINLPDYSGNPTVHNAYKYIKMFKYLTYHPDFDVNATDLYGKTVGIKASKEGNIHFIAELINDPPKGFNPNFINYLAYNPETILNSADDAETLKKVLQIKGIDINLSNEYMDPAIIQAIKEQNYDKFKVLIHHPDINIDAKGVDGKNILECVAELNDYSIKEDFLRSIRAVQDEKTLNKMQDIVDKVGTPDLEIINNYLDYPNISKIINESISESNETVVHFLAEYRVTDENKEKIEKLFEKLMQAKPNLDKPDRYGLTPLMKAVNAQNLFAIEFLLKNGADKSIKNKGGESAADMAKTSGKPEIIELFSNNPIKETKNATSEGDENFSKERFEILMKTVNKTHGFND